MIHGQEAARRAKSGPVTLSQARALAKVRTPAPRGAKVALVTTSPAKVGLERRKLELKQAQERRKRVKEYKATLAIMKKRGVKGLTPKTVKGGRAPKTAGKPLQVFAEGDSWFDIRCRSSAAASFPGSRRTRRAHPEPRQGR